MIALAWLFVAHGAPLQGEGWTLDVADVTLGPAPVGAECVATIVGDAVADLACSGAPTMLLEPIVRGWTIHASGPGAAGLVTVRQAPGGAEVVLGPALPLVGALDTRAAPAVAGPPGSCELRVRVSADGSVAGAWAYPLTSTAPPDACPPAAAAAAVAGVRAWTYKPPKVDGRKSDVLVTLVVPVGDG